MNARPLLLALALLAGMRAPAAGAEFLRIWPAWQEAAAFDRIGEYFGAAEPGAGTTVLRTTPDAREGYYFLTRVRIAATANGARFELQVIRPDAPTPVIFQFPANVPAGETAFQLGLTGAAWPGGRRANPVAWKLSLFDGNGRLLAEHKSFLWEKPAP
jgi:hypothetical protein